MSTNWLYKLERKYGKFAIKNLTTIMLGFYIVGFIIDLLSESTGTDYTQWLTLNPYLILHGQVWRLVSWLLVFPGSSSGIIFVLITLLFYFSIGRTMEMAWGDFRYTLYILSGVLFTIVGAFILYGIAFWEFRDILANDTMNVGGQLVDSHKIFEYYGLTSADGDMLLPGYWFANISTYYISMSLFLAYATTFPEHRVMLYFVIPVKVKWLGYLYAAVLGYSVITSLMSHQYFMVVIIVMSLLNFLLFFFTTRDYKKISPMDAKRRADYRSKVRHADINSRQEASHQGKQVFTRHKCAICGKTELDGANLQFRYCSKCDGNYEYCEEHLYTHEHVKRV